MNNSKSMLERLQFPWRKLDPGRGFFIPCLEIEQVRRKGLREALKLGLIDARASVGVKGGAIGVLFFRLPRKKIWPARSARRESA